MNDFTTHNGPHLVIQTRPPCTEVHPAIQGSQLEPHSFYHTNDRRRIKNVTVLLCDQALSHSTESAELILQMLLVISGCGNILRDVMVMLHFVFKFAIFELSLCLESTRLRNFLCNNVGPLRPSRPTRCEFSCFDADSAAPHIYVAA